MSTYNRCINIIEDKKTLTHLELMKKWDIFKNKHPRLYDMLTLSDTIDLKMLKFLCDSAENHEKLTKEQLLEKEFEIGDKLAQTYIYDKFREPSNQEKEFIKDSLRKKLRDNKSLVNEDFENKN